MQLLKLLVFMYLSVLASSFIIMPIMPINNNKNRNNAKRPRNNNNNKNNKNNNKNRGKQTCPPQPPGDYCFGTEYDLKTPLNRMFMTPKEMDVKFFLFTCKSKDISQNFTYLSQSCEWKNSNFDTNVITRFIVHGHSEKYPGNSAGFNWMEQIKDIALKKSCVNVVAIDWQKPASNPDYFSSVAYTRVVGKMVGCVINRWKAELKYSPEKVHMIGHSLGGEVAGFAGKEVNDPKIGQITGLDPAGPGYEQFSDANKLAATDAQCVNVIHTNGARTLPILDGYGHLKPMGHVDFYPNGGHYQPGCSNTSDVLFKFGNLVIPDSNLCPHVRSNWYAIADQSYANVHKCQLIGYRCTSYDDFMLGKCGADCGADGSGCKPMPLNLDYWDDPHYCDSNATHIEYYLNTGDVEYANHYCLFHYQIIVNVKSAVKTCLGEITIKLSNGKEIDVKLEHKNSLDSKDGNKRFGKLFTDLEVLPDFTTADVISTPLVELACSINMIEFNYMSSLDWGYRKTKSSYLCSTDGKAFTNKCI